MSKCLYVLGLLARAKKLPEEFNFQIVPQLLSKIAELRCSVSDVADIVDGLGLIAQAGKFPAGVDVQTLQELLNKARQETSVVRIVMIIHGLGLMARADKLSPQLDVQIIHYFLDKIKHADIPALSLINMIHSIGSLAKVDKLPPEFDAQVIQNFLDKIRIENHSLSDLAAVINSFGIMAKAGKLPPKLDIQTLQNFQNSLSAANIGGLTAWDVTNTIHGWALMSQAGFPVELWDIQILNSLLNKLFSLNLSELDVSRTFYSLGLIADKLPRGLDAQILPGLLNRVIKLETTSISITNIIYGLALMEEARILARKPNKHTVSMLLAKLQLERRLIPSNEASQILYGLKILLPHPSLDSLPCSGLQLIKLFEALINTSYLHPNKAASLIDIMVNFRVLHRELDGLFQRLLPSLALSFHQFSPKSQALFKTNLQNLRDYPKWQTALQVQLGLKKPAPIEMTEARVVPVTVSPPSPEHVESKSSAASAPRDVTLFPPPAPPTRSVGSAVKSKVPPSSLLSKAIGYLPGWDEAMQTNTLFALIADKDRQGLRDLLGINRSSHQGRGVPQENPRNRISVLAQLARDRGVANLVSKISPHSDIDSLVAGFLKNTPRELLVALFKTSDAECVKALLEACSRHTRYQLAISNALHLLILHIPNDELGDMIKAFEALEFYRDHTALLKLDDALLIRRLGSNSAEQVARIRGYQETLIRRAIKFHDETNHYHVVPWLTSALRNVRRMNYLPEEELDLDIQESGTFSSAKEIDKRATDTVAAASTVGMFAKNSSKRAGASSKLRDILKDYQYRDADMQAILGGRLETLNNPNIYLLGQAKMGQMVAAGNTVKAVLSGFIMREDALQALTESQMEMTFVIPIESGHHWTGICIKITPDKKAQIMYFDSLTHDSSSLQQDILRDVHQVLRPLGYSVSLSEFRDVNRLIQSDGTSCGPFLIENIYGHLRGHNRLAHWSAFQGEALVEAVHNRQLTVLQESRPAYLAVLKEQAQSEAPQPQRSLY